MQYQTYKTNKTTRLFHNLDKFVFLVSGINYWVDDNGLPDIVLKLFRNLAKVMNAVVIFFMFAEIGSFFTQHDLTEKQQADRLLMIFSHLTLYSFTLSLVHHKKPVTELLFALGVELKKDFNDEETERQMLKRTRFFAFAFCVVCFNALVFYGIDGLLQVCFAAIYLMGTVHESVIRAEHITDGTFVTVITVWPEVHDPRTIAEVGRIAFYILWWLWMLRVSTPYLLVLTITISLSHQYTNLQLYFKSLADIFEERISQREKEIKFERAFIVGTKLHARTIWCTRQAQKTCGAVYSGHIIVNVTVLVLLLSQITNAGRTLGNLLPIAATALSALFATGVIMWNAGDITVEASHLPTAIFLSGWQNCTKMASYRIRRLLLIALIQSQKPVVLKSCGLIGMSYQSYLSIVKTSYSIFSVLY